MHISQTPAAGTLVGLGVTTVTLHVIDAANNESTCTAQLHVTDNTPPTISTCASNQSALPMEFVRHPCPTHHNGLVASDCKARHQCTSAKRQPPDSGRLGRDHGDFARHRPRRQ